MVLGVTVEAILAWSLAAFFLVGAVGNWLAPAKVRADYVRWGYPDGFHRITSVLEFATSILLVFPSTRIPGIGLGVAIMLAAIITLLRSREYLHSLFPSVVLLLLLLVAAV